MNRRHPAVVLTGPRQAGKTTLARFDKTADLIGATERIFISRAPHASRGVNRQSCSLPDFLAWLTAG